MGGLWDTLLRRGMLSCVLALLPLNWAWTAETQLSAHFNGTPLGSASGLLSELWGQDIAPESELIGHGGIWLHLHQAPPAAVLQGLSHASDSWWWQDTSSGRYRLSSTLNARRDGALTVRAYPSSLINRHDIEPIVHQLMEPWLRQPGSGLASVPWNGQWTATLDRQGHAQLSAVLRSLDIVDHQVPSPRPQRDLPAPQTFKDRQTVTLSAASWPALMLRAAQHFDFSLAISPRAAAITSQAPITIEVTSITQLAAKIRQSGFSAEWLHGVLCIDLLPPGRRAHPLQQRRLALIPIPHLTERLEGNLVANALMQRTSSISWNTLGRLCAFIDHPPRLLISVEESAFNSVLDALDLIETNAHRGWRP